MPGIHELLALGDFDATNFILRGRACFNRERQIDKYGDFLRLVECDKRVLP